MLNESILPKGMRVEMFFDRTTLVEHTLSTVHKNLLHGFILVVAVVWLFLRSVVGSAIVAVVIPLSLLVAFLGLYALGLPANLISMGAIDFGILVDGAVVLAEHVIHSMRHDPPADQKALLRQVVRSALEVGRPTFYAMLIIIAALVPVFTLQSVEGRIFRPLALTYAFALLGALVFSITLVPALCALFFRPHHAKLHEPRWQERLREAYQGALVRILGRRPLMLIAAAGLLAVGALCVDAPRHRVSAGARRRRHPDLRRDAGEHRARKRTGDPGRSPPADTHLSRGDAGHERARPARGRHRQRRREHVGDVRAPETAR